MNTRAIDKAHAVGHPLTVLLATGLLSAALHAEAQTLTLAAAEALALRADPSVQAVQSRRKALEELAVADAQLPDPMLQAGLKSLPTDSWELGQEDMTRLWWASARNFRAGGRASCFPCRLSSALRRWMKPPATGACRSNGRCAKSMSRC